ncbi:nuclear transport factor 2 family protein [Endozoicomonas sp. ONNA2]|uniref:nuclear transport factor 2 family protein n=1 Tax=Endozoicomonas sp. ONNA2 TaxID=2828741 RepID=UPI0021485260|nr:nuclear transport factor 2 family protein [Endozoicomonas sp. ONNA2]
MANDIRSVLHTFNDAFSNQRLDEVMNYFADECEFREMNGHNARGKQKVRKAINFAFSGMYGKLTFIEKSMLIDEQKKTASFAWYCQHDMLPVEGMSFMKKLIAAMIKLRFGQSFHWEGMDYFVFDDELKIISKQSYGRAAIPKFVRGVAPCQGV